VPRALTDELRGKRRCGTSGAAACPGLRHYHPRLLALTVPHIACGRTAREPRVLAEQAATRLSRPPDPLGYAYQLYAGLGWSSLPWLHRVQHESLVVAGEQDPTVSLRNARLRAARLPQA
jgi:hypothetical protein